MRERIVAAVERFAETGMGDVRRLRGKEQEIYRLRIKWGLTTPSYVSGVCGSWAPCQTATIQTVSPSTR